MTNRILLFCYLLISSLSSRSQQTRIYTDPLQVFQKAKELYQKGEFNLAYPLFLDVRNNTSVGAITNYRIAREELDYYTIACGLRQNETSAEKQAQSFVRLAGNSPLQQKMSFQLAEYYFRNGDFRNAILLYEESNPANLSKQEAAGMDFRLGYGYFTLQQYDRAKPLLNRASNNAEGPYYLDANYYYGYLAFADKKYTDALEHFKRVEGHPQYGNVVPYYIASIYYQQGKKEQAVAYAEDALKKTSASSFEAGLRRMLGQAYFEKRQFAKALPMLEAYTAQAEKPSREDIYQVSYSYYETRQYPNAIKGFKELTDGLDSLSQSAMYLLGDAYLKTGQRENARNAFSFSARNNSNVFQREVSMFHYGKLSYELGYQDIAMTEMRSFISDFPNSTYAGEARELLVRMLAGTSNYREALSLLESSSSASPAARQLYPRVLYGRAMELIADENLSGAETLLDRILTTPQNNLVLPATYFWKGEIAYKQNRLDAAIRSLSQYLESPTYRAAEVTPENARYTLGYALLRRESYAQARDQFDLVARNATSTQAPAFARDAYVRSADCSFMLREFTKARSQYNTAVSSNWPASDYATYQLAMIAGVGSSSDKIKLLQNFDRKFPGSTLVPTVNLEIANSLLADEKFREAIPYLSNLLKSEPPSSAFRPKAYLRLGIAQYNLDNNREALNNYQKLVAEFPNAPEVEEALESARAIFVEEGRTNEYVEFARLSGRPVSVSEQDSLAFAAAEARYASGDQAGAIAALSGYLKQFPSGAYAIEALYMRSDLHQKRKETQNALAGFEKLSDLAPNKYAEQATAQAAKTNFFEVKDFAKAEIFFNRLISMASTPANRLDAMRGLLRSQYQLKKWEEGAANATQVLDDKSSGADDRMLASMMLGKFHQNKSRFPEAIQQFRTVVSLSKAAYAAEARYEIAASYFAMDDLKNTEKMAFETINKSGSYDFWITKAYILIADVFLKQKDVFNAKATLQSVVDNSRIPELKAEAESKLARITAEDEKK